jgi:hypothetical protein
LYSMLDWDLTGDKAVLYSILDWDLTVDIVVLSIHFLVIYSTSRRTFVYHYLLLSLNGLLVPTCPKTTFVHSSYIQRVARILLGFLKSSIIIVVKQLTVHSGTYPASYPSVVESIPKRTTPPRSPYVTNNITDTTHD